MLELSQRLGAQDGEGYPSVRNHPFFEGVEWDKLHQTTPPPMYPFLPGNTEGQDLRSHYRVSKLCLYVITSNRHCVYIIRQHNRNIVKTKLI